MHTSHYVKFNFLHLDIAVSHQHWAVSYGLSDS